MDYEWITGGSQRITSARGGKNLPRLFAEESTYAILEMHDRVRKWTNASKRVRDEGAAMHEARERNNRQTTPTLRIITFGGFLLLEQHNGVWKELSDCDLSARGPSLTQADSPQTLPMD